MLPATEADRGNPPAYFWRALSAAGFSGTELSGLVERAGPQTGGHMDPASLTAAVEFVIANKAQGDAGIAKSTADQLERDRLANIDRARPDFASGPFPASECLPLAVDGVVNKHANFLHAVSQYYSGHTGRNVYADALHGDAATVDRVIAIEAGAVDWTAKQAYNGPLVQIVDGLISQWSKP